MLNSQKAKVSDMTTVDTTRAAYAAPVAERALRKRVLHAASHYGTVMVLVALIIGFSISYPDLFPTVDNAISILSQVAILGIIAGGLTIALVAGEFDLSVGYLASFSGVLVTGFMTKQGMPLVLAIAATCAVSLLVGLVNGLLVTKVGVNSFITTLGIGTVLVGFNFAYNSGIAIAAGVPESFQNFSINRVFGLPKPVLVTVAVLAVLWVVLNRTQFGLNVRAVGGSNQAALLAGVHVDRTRIAALMVSSLCAGISGILLASQLGSGQPTAGDGFLLQAFAAAFLGSVALRDAQFHIIGTVIGALTIGVGFTGLAIAGAPTYFQYLFNGGLLVGAVALSTLARRMKDR
jgi:ribose transport system permease protein